MLVARSYAEDLVLDIETVYWEGVRETVHQVNPELADICDQISPNKQHPLIKIRYPYGAKIVDHGNFHLPTPSHRLVSIRDSRINPHLQQQLSYCSIPLSLVLHNNIEVFVEANNRVTPLNFFKPGDLFGVFESMNPLTHTQSHPIWNVTAGGRSVFMIPRITDKVGHNRIRKEFGISSETPTDLTEQWKIFTGIAQHATCANPWYSEVLVFTDRWFEDHNDDVSWLKFHRYLFKLCWLQMQLMRDATEFCLLWSSFGEAMNYRNLKPRPYLVDTLKHLVSIANGAGVAFKPAMDEATLPVRLIQAAYVDCYNLKTYMPTIMQPCKLQGEDKKAYYSLALPTVLESSPYVKNAPSMIEDERDIKRLMDTLIKTIQRGNTMIDPIKHVNYEFFHTDTDQYGEILSSRDIIAGDPRFNYTLSDDFKDRIFCATSPFFRGCIRISVIR